MSEEPYLLVWRGWQNVPASEALSIPKNHCRYCKAPLISACSDYGWNVDRKCKLCGWAHNWETQDVYEDGFVEEEHRAKERILKAFRISSSKVALAELGTHLKRRFSDVYSLSPYRFEELIGDVFREIGYKVEMTKRSHDGGVDLFLLSGVGDRIGIVQCKRHRKDRKIDVSIVSQLLGTQLAFDINRAILITTSEYTLPAIKRAAAIGVVRHGFEVDLLGATDVLRMLSVYNEELPALDKLSDDFLNSRGLIMSK